MISSLTEFANLPLSHLQALVAICFLAGIVRGFTGFALSALIMASAATMLPPIELIPVMWWLEISASLVLLRSGWRLGDQKIAIVLVATGVLGLPTGLILTQAMADEVSSIVALGILALLATLLICKVRLGFLATFSGLAFTGFAAGLVTGLSGAGGMIIALFVLAQNRAAAEMRATLVLFLLISSVVSFFWHLGLCTMTWDAVQRGVVLMPATLAGVLLGALFFTPKTAAYYRPFCLMLLIGLSLLGLTRIATS